MASLFDQFVQSVASAINDVREKVVEEGWFGRVVSPDTPPAPESAPEPSNAWQQHVQQVTQAANREDISPPDHGIDR